LLSTACGVRPEAPNRRTRPDLSPVRERLPLNRFRQIAPVTEQPKAIEPPSYQPPEEIALAHPTNFGQRFLQDINGQAVQNNAVVVLHENVGSAASTISYFQTPHPKDDDQISYHTLIKRDGTVTYMVPPDKRAFGAGNSIFASPEGNEAVKTNPNFPPSVNNFAYHISLVTPPDGLNNSRRHSGYTQAQYQSLAWLVAKAGVPEDRITTHQKVDRSNQRMDPRSFNQSVFLKLLATYPKTNEISIACTPPQ
jgi:N-acetylmuramoyl-L-alanine amidase